MLPDSNNNVSDRFILALVVLLGASNNAENTYDACCCFVELLFGGGMFEFYNCLLPTAMV